MRILITWFCLAAAAASARPVSRPACDAPWRADGVTACVGDGGRYARVTFTDAGLESLAALLHAAPAGDGAYDIAYAPALESARVTLSLEDVTLGEAARRFAAELGDCALVNATARRVTLRAGLDCPIRIVLGDGALLPGSDAAPSLLLDNGDGTLGTAATSGGLVSLSVVDVPLPVVIEVVAQASGRDVRLAAELRGLRVSVEARGLPWRELLQAMLPAIGALRQDAGGAIVVAPDPLHQPAFVGDGPMGE